MSRRQTYGAYADNEKKDDCEYIQGMQESCAVCGVLVSSQCGCVCFYRDQVSENIEQNAQHLFEEMGVESDEACNADLKQVQQLMPKRIRW